MRGRAHQLAMALVCTVLALGVGADAARGATARAAPAGVDTAAPRWRVVGQRQVALTNARILSLSLDGQWFAAYLSDAGRVCIYAVASLARGHCAGLPDGAIDPLSVAWSPDSTRLALTENLFTNGSESDIWVFDRASGRLADLTDDGVSGDVLSGRLHPAGGKAQYDVVPAWSPDGRALVFGRTPSAAACGERGPPAPIRPSTWSRPRAAPRAGSSTRRRARRSTCSTTCAGRAPGRSCTPSAPAAPTTRPPACGAWTPTAATRDSWPNRMPGSARRCSSGPRRAGTRRSSNAVFSPDGSSVLYVYLSLTYRSRLVPPPLVVRDLRSGSERPLVQPELPQSLRGSTGIGQGLDWASSNTVYVAASPSSGLLLTLTSR